jgi:ABC-type Fe3+-hydroxamate transport system substrate-binding protein
VSSYFSINVWLLAFDGGYQDHRTGLFSRYSWAVHDGNVVPVPAAVWLFGSGLPGLIGISRRKRAA